MRRRAILRGGALLVGISTSGCLDGRLSDLGGPQPTNVDEQYPLPVRESELTRDQLQTHAGTLQDRYETAGIWGTRKASPDHDLSFSGAWLAEHPFDEFVVEHTAVLFRLPDSATGERTHYQLLLWAGIDTFAAGIRPNELGIGVDIGTEAGAMGVYAPDHSVTDGYAVGIGRMDIETVSTEMPLPAGTVSPAADGTSIGEGGAFALVWNGEHDGQIAIAGTCELRVHPEDDPAIEWDIWAEVAQAEP